MAKHIIVISLVVRSVTLFLLVHLEAPLAASVVLVLVILILLFVLVALILSFVTVIAVLILIVMAAAVVVPTVVAVLVLATLLLLAFTVLDAINNATGYQFCHMKSNPVIQYSSISKPILRIFLYYLHYLIFFLFYSLIKVTFIVETHLTLH